jgi:tetratricopeptide (TPR) repeat protein
MSSYTLICTECNAALQAAGPVPRGRVIRCPQCGSQFAAGEPEAPAVAVTTAATPTLKLGLLAFGFVGLLAVAIGAAIALAVYSNNDRAKDTAVEAERRAAEAERRAADERAALQRRLDEQRYEEARSRRRLEQKIRELEEMASARPDRRAPAAPVAVAAATPAPAPEPKAAADDADKKNRADYEARMDAARAAMVNQRYDDALREYRAALRLVPGDAAASQGERDALDRLDALRNRDKRRTSVAALVDKAKSALRARHYDEALDSAKEALQINPNDPEAKQVRDQAAQGKRASKADYAQVMAAANDALSNGRYEEASRLYARALQLAPDDDAAQRGKRAADQATQDTQAGLSAYYRFMAVGTLSMQNLQYAAAAQAFGEALRAAPGDLAAAKGLSDAQNAVAGAVVAQAAYYQQLQAGYAALQSQRSADAAAAFQAALRMQPGSPLATAGLQQARAMRK